MEPHFLKAIISAFHPPPPLVSLIISVQAKAGQVGRGQNTSAVKPEPLSLAFLAENEVGPQRWKFESLPRCALRVCLGDEPDVLMDLPLLPRGARNNSSRVIRLMMLGAMLYLKYSKYLK